MDYEFSDKDIAFLRRLLDQLTEDNAKTDTDKVQPAPPPLDVVRAIQILRSRPRVANSASSSSGLRQTACNL